MVSLNIGVSSKRTSYTQRIEKSYIPCRHITSTLVAIAEPTKAKRKQRMIDEARWEEGIRLVLMFFSRRGRCRYIYSR
jgi:hypothetical protein